MLEYGFFFGRAALFESNRIFSFNKKKKTYCIQIRYSVDWQNASFILFVKWFNQDDFIVIVFATVRNELQYARK